MRGHYHCLTIGRYVMGQDITCLSVYVHFFTLFCRYAMSFAGNELKMMYVNRTPESNKTIHVVSSAYKATFTWNNMRTLQVSIAIILGLIDLCYWLA